MNAPFPKTIAARRNLLVLPPLETPTLEVVIGQLESDGRLAAVRRRDLISSLRRIAAALDLPISQVPAHPAWLRQRLLGVMPTQLGRSAKTRANVLSNAMAALAQTGVTQRRPRPPDRAAEWQQLWDKLATSPRIALGSFIRFCSHNHILPHEVTERVVGDFEKVMVAASLRKQPARAIYELSTAWNKAVELGARLASTTVASGETTLAHRAAHW